MKNIFFGLIITGSLVFACSPVKEEPSNAEYINPFICTGGDHGQTDVAAAVPFGMVKPCPDSDPINHSGYNFDTDKVLGFSNTRFSGVGCRGTGGNLRLIPYVGEIDLENPSSLVMDKTTEKATPGYYSVQLQNDVGVELTATRQLAIHKYQFPEANSKGILIDLGASFMPVIDVAYEIQNEHTIVGSVKSVNVCEAKFGIYQFYFAIKIDAATNLQKKGNKVLVQLKETKKQTTNTYVALSTVSVQNALQTLETEASEFEVVKENAFQKWADLVDVVEIETENEELRTLFYTHLYHVTQSPFQVQDFNGQFRGSDNEINQLQEGQTHYLGWSIWDTFRSKHPLLSVLYPERYSEILTSLCKLYQQGKQPWATQTESFPTIRTEHTVVVLLDGYRKGLLDFDLNQIYPEIKYEIDSLLEWHSPGHILESTYDSWAFAQIAKELGHQDDYEHYLEIAMNYKATWEKVFLQLGDDADVMHARGLYEGTLWQYRWFVPFDMAGIQEMLGGKKVFEEQLDTFFSKDLFNIGNQPDIQVPYLFNYTDAPWKSQQLVRRLLTEKVANWYGTHKKWEKPETRKIFQPTPHGYISEMDDDAGTMSAWYILSSMGLYQTCPGEPYFWLTIPLYKSVKINLPGDKSFTIKVDGENTADSKIKTLSLNGKQLNELRIDYADIYAGGELIIKTE